MMAVRATPRRGHSARPCTPKFTAIVFKAQSRPIIPFAHLLYLFGPPPRSDLRGNTDPSENYYKTTTELGHTSHERTSGEPHTRIRHKSGDSNKARRLLASSQTLQNKTSPNMQQPSLPPRRSRRPYALVVRGVARRHRPRARRGQGRDTRRRQPTSRVQPPRRSEVVACRRTVVFTSPAHSSRGVPSPTRTGARFKK